MKVSLNGNNAMTRRQQKMFVRDLCANITAEVESLIADGKVPEDWDGHELRCLLAEKFTASALMTIVKREPRNHRARDYRHTVIVNNL